MNVKTLIPLVAGLAIGGFALKMGIDTLQKAKAAPPATVSVWTAKVDIQRGMKITEEMIQAVAYPENLAPPKSFKEKEALIGRVARVDTPAALPILESMLAPPGELPGLQVARGLRAVAVRIDEGSGVDFHLEPGCRVDVVGYFTVAERGKQTTIARTLIENVEVGAVGARLSAMTNEGGDQGGRPTRAVTLFVTPDKVPLLHLAEQKGKIKLSMRGRDDADPAGKLEPIDDEFVVSGRKAKAAEAAAAAPSATPAVNRSWLRNLFQQPARSDPPPPAPAAALVVEPPPPAAEPEWVVHVWRGEKLEVVRFKHRDSRERLGLEPGSKPAPRQAAPPSSPPRSAPPRASAGGSSAPSSAGPPSGEAPPADDWEPQPRNQESQESR